MSNLVQDIESLKFLPQDWQVEEFTRVVSDNSGGNIKLAKSKFLESGKYPIVDQGKEIVAGYSDNEGLLVKSKPPYVIFGDHTRVFKYIDYPFVMGADGVKVLQPRNLDCLPKFLYYFFRNINVPNTGYNRHFKYLKDLKIPLPPIETQKKIASILDAADAYRQKTKALIQKYDELTQSLFLEMFGDPVTNPKGWEVKKIEDVCDKIFGGGTPSKAHPEYYNGDIPWVTPKDMKFEYISDSIDHINQVAVDNSSAKLIPEESVLMVIRSGILKHTLPVAINTRIVTVNQDMKAFIPLYDLTNSVYLKSFFQAISGYLLSKVRAVTADNIEFKQIKELNFICPPINLQNQFAERVQQIEKQKAQAQQSLTKAEELFNSLLQRAFKGEIA